MSINVDFPHPDGADITMNRGFVFISPYYIKVIRVSVRQRHKFGERTAADLRRLRGNFGDGRTARRVLRRAVRLEKQPVGRNPLHKLAVVHRVIVQYGRSDRDVAVQGDDVGDKAAGTGEAVEEKCLGGLESLEGLEGLDCLHHLTPAFGPMKHNRATKFQR